MWAWYLEWSQVARIAIKQRLLLKELGFLTTRRGGTNDEETDPTTPTTTPVTTPATTPATTTPAAASAVAH